MDKDFENLLNKRFKSETSREEEKLIHDLTNSDADHQAQADFHQEFIEKLVAHTRQSRLKLLKTIDRQAEETVLVNRIGSFNVRLVAALVVLIAGVLVMVYFNRLKPVAPAGIAQQVPVDALATNDSLVVEASGTEAIDLMKSGSGRTLLVPLYRVNNLEDFTDDSPPEPVQFSIQFIQADKATYRFYNRELTIYINLDEITRPDFSCQLVYSSNADRYALYLNGKEHILKEEHEGSL